MKVKLLITTALCFVVSAAFAQTQNETVNKALKWSKEQADKLDKGNFDPDYVGVPDNKWLVTVSVNGHHSKFNLDVPCPYLDILNKENNTSFQETPEIARLSTYKFRLHQGYEGASIGVGYGSIRAKYTFNIGNKNESQFNLEALGSKFGCMVDYRHSKSMKGTAYNALNALIFYLDDVNHRFTVDEIMNDATDDISSRQNDYTTLHIQGHYIFNHRRFAYSAAQTSTRIQKRSAGSPIVLLDYYRSKAKFNQTLLLGRDESFTTNKGSVGAGYAYNYTPNGGKLLLHASVIPSVTLLSKSDYSTHVASQEKFIQKMFSMNHPEESLEMSMEELMKKYPEDVVKYTESYDAEITNPKKYFTSYISATPKVTLNCTARVSALWNIDSHYVLEAYGSYQYSNYANKEHYSFKEHNLYGQICLGYRF